MALGSSQAGIAASLVAIATRTDTTATLAEIPVPTSVIVGAGDLITPPSAAQLLADQIAHATLHIIPDAGHLTDLEAEDTFNRLLIERIQSVV